MSEIKGRIGGNELVWNAPPKGQNGTAVVHIQGQSIEVRWRRDSSGLWLETPNGVSGFDFQREVSDEGLISFRVSQRGTPHAWAGLHFSRAGEDMAVAAQGAKKKGVRVRAQMPGKIIRISVTAGDNVEKDQSLAVMEAMKMENEIRATQSGVVSKVSVTAGQAVESGAELFVIG